MVQFRRRRGGNADAVSDPSALPRPVIGLFRDDCVEIVDGDDAILLYNHGFYGKGTVSRRQPNKGSFNVVLPPSGLRPEAAAAAAAAAEEGAEGEEAVDAVEGPAAAQAPSPPASVLPSRLAASCTPLPAEEDVLSLSAEAFDRRVAEVPLAEAFAAAAYAAAHGQDETDFETARQTAHYISCPPPRLRMMGGAAGAPAAAGAGAGERAVQETSLVEPEAAMYLALRHPGKLLVFLTPAQAAAYSLVVSQTLAAGGGVDDVEAATAAALAQPLEPRLLWALFCARIPDFPARLAVYMRFRDEGWVVREGHAFGADFVLYTAGPGIDHAVHCVTVGPLRVVPHVKARLDGAGSEGAGAAAAAVPSSSSPFVRAPTRRVMGTWVDMHALSRVVAAVKKHSLIAHVTLHLEVDSLDAVRGPCHPLPPAGRDPAAYLSVDGKPLAAIPIALRRSPVTAPAGLPSLPGAGEPQSGADSGSSGGAATTAAPPPPALRQPFYSGAVASWLASPACVSTLAVATASVDRWAPMQEGVKKTSALMTHIAAAASRAEAEDGIKINLTALVASGSGNTAAGRGGDGGAGSSGVGAEAGEGGGTEEGGGITAALLLAQPLKPLCGAMTGDALLLHAWGYSPALVDAIAKLAPADAAAVDVAALAAEVAAAEGGAATAVAEDSGAAPRSSQQQPNKAVLRHQVRQLLQRQAGGQADDAATEASSSSLAPSLVPSDACTSTRVQALVLSPLYDSRAVADGATEPAAAASVLTGLYALRRAWRVVEALGEAGRLRPAARTYAAALFKTMPHALSSSLQLSDGVSLTFAPWAAWLAGGSGGAGTSSSGLAVTDDDGGVFCKSAGGADDGGEGGAAGPVVGASPLPADAVVMLTSDPPPPFPPLALGRALEAHAPFIASATAQFEVGEGAAIQAALAAAAATSSSDEVAAEAQQPPAKRPRLEGGASDAGVAATQATEHEALKAAALAALYPVHSSSAHPSFTRPSLPPCATPLALDCYHPSPPSFGLSEEALTRIANNVVPTTGPGAGPQPAAGPALRAWRRERHAAAVATTASLHAAVTAGSVAARRAAGLSCWQLPQRAWSHASLLDKVAAAQTGAAAGDTA